jgi:hypothetical protein
MPAAAAAAEAAFDSLSLSPTQAQNTQYISKVRLCAFMSRTMLLAVQPKNGTLSISFESGEIFCCCCDWNRWR